MTGRPTKLTPEIQKRITDALAAGNYKEASVAYAGIKYQTFLNWMERGQEAKSGPFFDFFEAVQLAEAQAEVRIVAQWQQQIPDNWQAARDFLARRHPDRWGPKEKHEVTGRGDGPIQITTTIQEQADQELAAWRRKQIEELSSGPAAALMQVISPTTSE